MPKTNEAVNRGLARIKAGSPLVTATPKPEVEDPEWEEYKKSPEGGFAAQRGPKFEAWKTSRKKMKPVPKPTPTPGLTSLAK